MLRRGGLLLLIVGVVTASALVGLGGRAVAVTVSTEAELKGAFTTMNPAKQVRATINPIDNATVGVGMPVSVKFDSAPKDRAAGRAHPRAWCSPRAGWTTLRTPRSPTRPNWLTPAVSAPPSRSASITLVGDGGTV